MHGIQIGFETKKNENWGNKYPEASAIINFIIFSTIFKNILMFYRKAKHCLFN